jgi:GNAT superfamily N-acetyltransferase
VADAPAIAAIYCATLGPGYTTADAIAQDVAGRTRCLYVVAEVDGAVVGAANALWVERPEVLELGAVGFHDVQREVLELGRGALRFGLLENVGVLPGHRGRGLGADLLDRRLDWLRGQHVGAAYSFAWRSTAGCPAGPLLERAGFARVRELADFYLEDGLANGYGCPYCGAECHCSAILYFRRL